MAVSAARAAAFDILKEVEQRESFAVDLLHSRRTEDLSPRDAALCTQLVMGVLRWQSALDAEIAQAVTQKLDVEVRLALRLGLYQLRHLERVPQRSAVNESVELVKRARKRSAASLVNAVLRKLGAAEPHKGASLAERYAHPEWLVERWVRQYGEVRAENICAFDQETPTTWLRLPFAETEHIAAELEVEGVKLAPGAILRTARRVVAGDVTTTKAYREGRVAIQDEGSQLVAALVGTGQHILDCCAAPGGKTAAIADRNPEAKITAVEMHEHRLRVMRKLVRANNVEFVQSDATKLPGAVQYDRILADVPCTGTGTIARNPEIKWRLNPEDVQQLQAKQIQILRSVAERLERAGRLVYSTCSLEAEENERVVEALLAERPEMRRVECGGVLAQLRGAGDVITSEIDVLCDGPYLRTIPGVHRCDGFFAAVIERTSG